MTIQKYLQIIICSSLCLTSYAQNEELRHTYFLDSLSRESSPDSAIYKNLQYKTNEGWKIEYWVRNENAKYLLAKTEWKSDTSNKPQWVKIIRYYSNNIPMEFRELHAGEPQSTIHYSPVGVKDAEIIYEKGTIVSQEGWDSLGHMIPHFIYEKEAEFPKGAEGWKQYLVKNLKTSVPADNDAPIGNYIVVVSFIVDKNGNIVQAKANNNPGYGTAEEAVRVIAHSPKWIPAIQMNKNVLYRQRQQITFQVTVAPKKDTIIAYLDKNQTPIDKNQAFLKGVDIKVDDSTRKITTYLLSNNKLIAENLVITSTNGIKHGHFKSFSREGILSTEVDYVGKDPKRIIKYYPNGQKSSEVIYGDIGLPIKETRWDDKGNFIDPTKIR